LVESLLERKPPARFAAGLSFRPKAILVRAAEDRSGERD
jgi:hypothetical protein